MPEPRYPFQPDYAVPPGETLKETLEFVGLTVHDLSVKSGLSELMINGIIDGKVVVTTVIATLLERYTKVPKGMWLNLENNYQKQLSHHGSS